VKETEMDRMACPSCSSTVSRHTKKCPDCGHQFFTPQKRGNLFGSLGLAFDILSGSLRLLRAYPVLILPLMPVFIMVLGVEFFFVSVENPFLLLINVFMAAYGLMFSSAITSCLLSQINRDEKPSLVRAISSPELVRMIPLVFLLSLVWYALILLLVAAEIAIGRLLGDNDGKTGEGSSGFIDTIFGTVAAALRMMGFMLVPIMLFEDVGLLRGFHHLRKILTENPISALGGLALTKATALLTGIIYLAFRYILVDVLSAQAFVLSLVIGILLLGIGWTLTMYLEQIFVTGLYLYCTYPDSPVVDLVLGKHIGTDLPRIVPPPTVKPVMI
jgi:hypothetical protein